MSAAPRLRRAAAAVALASALAIPALASGAEAAPRVRHRLEVTLDPATRTLAVHDRLRVPHGGDVEFLLNAKLVVTNSEPPAQQVPLGDVTPFTGINASPADLAANGGLVRYRVRLPEGGGQIEISYAGPFDFGLGSEAEQYQRGFRETAGIVSPEGVYLAGNGFWYPQIDRGLIEFELTATAPEGWHLISQGNGSSRDAEGRARWDSAGPMDEIYLVGGPLVRYRQAAGAVEAEVYLRAPDEALASKYLAATAQYLEMYRGLLGPYPYGKFALVENFWETGYGMPSFTLLGPQVIRLPFILASSYPHEILHNWWGNSVFVDYESGNWCEGLTAYLADHLIQEQRGQGEAYRRDTLQKYRSYVRDGRDFPLVEFRARHSAATEAVGYGKSLMGFHMLRRKLGDDAFRDWAARFYREEKGKQASFADIRRSAEAVAKTDLSRFFRDWTERPGAAELAVEVDGVVAVEGGFEVRGRLLQTQSGEPFALDVPLVVQTAGAAVETTVAVASTATSFAVRATEPPLALRIDPAFDLFRRLDPREIPASIGQIFGEPRVLAVLPADAPAEEAAAWRTLLESWRTDAHAIEFATDAEVTEVPADRAVWLLGRANRLAPRLVSGAAGLRVEADAIGADAEKIPFAGHTAVVVVRHPRSPERALGWIAADPLGALPGLGRKLPHYGKYSYLGFEGAEPVNTVKGQWAASDSPLAVDLRPAAARGTALPPAKLAPRKALAELPPVFSEKLLGEHVTWLAAPEREGRGIGTAGLDAAAEYVAAQFQAIGLRPGGDHGTWFQSFTTDRSPDGKPVALRNVLGILPGTKPELSGQSAVVSAHYDHLGFGFPDAHAEFKGRLHAGADDNASGVAVLIELARAAAAGAKPSRTLVFAAFAGEEAGLLGARHYAAHPAFPLEQTIGVVNLDTVGRLNGQKVTILAAGTATEWPHIFRGASFVTGVESRSIPDQAEASDQMAFIEKGVPAVQVFTQAHADYHRPGDTADRVDVPGLVKVATLAQECVSYLAERPEPLTVTIAPAARTAAPAAGTGPTGAPPAPAPGGRKVTVGTVPDFAFAGPGVRVDQVVPGSPAEQAGIRAGDVLLKLAGQPIESLRGYSQILGTLEPGQTIEVEIERDGARTLLSVTVQAR